MSITLQLNALINLLINQYYLYKFFQWNFEGEDFYTYRQLFDSHSIIILSSQDDIAEQIRVLQSKVSVDPIIVSLNEVITNQKNLVNILSMLEIQHDAVILEMTEVIKLANFSEDFATADLLADNLEKQQKMLWFITSSKK